MQHSCSIVLMFICTVKFSSYFFILQDYDTSVESAWEVESCQDNTDKPCCSQTSHTPLILPLTRTPVSSGMSKENILSPSTTSSKNSIDFVQSHFLANLDKAPRNAFAKTKTHLDSLRDEVQSAIRNPLSTHEGIYVSDCTIH
jgi:hypothetical protein